MDEVVLNKVATLERCLIRIREEFDRPWRTNYTVQDALVMNLERACQAAIDLGAHLVRTKKLGVPKQSREIFEILFEAGIIDQNLSGALARMVGFRNIAVHNYTSLNLNLVDHIVTVELSVFTEFSRIALSLKE